MANSLKNIFFSAMLLLGAAQAPLWAMKPPKAIAAPLAITLIWKESGQLKEEREVFLSSFKKAYAPLSKKELPIDDLDAFLNEGFDDEVKDLAKGDPKVFVLTATVDKKTAGFVACNKESETSIYIRQMAVHPDFWKKGVGKKLIHGIFAKFPQAKKFVLVTRRVNKGAIDFYSALGFKQSDYLHEGLSPERYVGYEYIVK